MIALDISQHAGEVAVSDFARAKALYATRVVVAMNDLDLAGRQIRNAIEAGLEVEAYSYLYFARAENTVEQVRKDLQALDGLGVTRLWLDAEDTSKGVTPAKIESGIASAAKVVKAAGYRTGVYTGRWYWMQFAGNAARFSDMDLWDAYWDGDDDIDRPAYGGWTHARMSQYAADQWFAGIWCDLSAYEADDAPIPLSPALTETDAGLIWQYAHGLRMGNVKVSALPVLNRRRRYEVELPL